MSQLRKLDNTTPIIYKYKIKLKSSMASINGYLVPPVNFNLENRVVSGLIEIEPRYQNNIGLFSMETQYTTTANKKTFVPIDDYDHVYTEFSKTVDNSIRIYTPQENFTFYNVYLNRHKSSEKLFMFMAQAAMENLLKFEQQFSIVPPKQLDRRQAML